MAKKKTIGESGEVEIAAQIEHVFPPELSRRYSNHMVVQREGGMVHLSFFEIPPPLILGTPQERKKRATELKKVTATCVAGIWISESKFPAFVSALVSQLPPDELPERSTDNSPKAPIRKKR